MSHLQFFQGEAPAGADLGVIADGGTPDDGPQRSGDWARGDAAGLRLTSLTSVTEQIESRLTETLDAEGEETRTLISYRAQQSSAKGFKERHQKMYRDSGEFVII